MKLISEAVSIEQIVLDWLDSNRDYAIALVPLLAFAESCVGIGLVVSGVLLLLVSATLYNNGIAGLEVLLPLAFFGALLGDHAGYYLGRTLGPRFHQIGLIKKYQANVAKAEGLILRYGSAAIFIGRFIPAIRSIIPALVGVSGLQRLRYSFIDALACLCWVLALAAILIGIVELL
ncbi:MAG: membrane-associated protein [Kiritimatiellia bacterium]